MWKHNDMPKNRDTPHPIPFESFDQITKEDHHF